MHIFYLSKKSILLYLSLQFSFLSVVAQSSEPSTIDLKEAQIIIDSLDKQFSKHYFDGDSVAIYAMYAKGASFGSLKGNDILLSWGRQIRDAIKNDTRHLIFKTTTLSTDNEFLVEIGKYEVKDSNSNVKGNGKYLVVWKNENGNWKLYKDMGL